MAEYYIRNGPRFEQMTVPVSLLVYLHNRYLFLERDDVQKLLRTKIDLDLCVL